MTMTSVAVAPGSFAVAPSAMLTPKMYLQQGLSSPMASPAPAKNYDTLSKSKKSWSVRLGLSRQSQNADDPNKGWGTISGGSALSRQMIYGDPWLYGTVRSSWPGHDPRAFLTPPPPPGTAFLMICSCPEFPCGTTRKLGNCRKCGGRRLAGVPLGGTCRLPAATSRSRPSLAGVLRSPMDDPYDQMRRNRLVEPRSRARSTSPHRPICQRDLRSQSAARGPGKERKSSTEGTTSRSEWFDKDTASVHEEATSGGNRKSRQNLTGANCNDHQWNLEDVATAKDAQTSWNGVPVSRAAIVNRNARANDRPSSDCSTSATTKLPEGGARTKEEQWKDGKATTDSRRSILECDVNPYLLLKKEKYEDDLSDDLSDNALEKEESKKASSSLSLFDPSKVKSIERIPNRGAVAAIGGQRIRVFNEPRSERNISEEEEDDESGGVAATRIPIPKVSPKRPPRKLKEAKQTLKSILKRGRVLEGKRKNVLFKVDNVIFAPEKPSEATRLSWSRIGSRFANCSPSNRKKEEGGGAPITGGSEQADEEMQEKEAEEEKESETPQTPSSSSSSSSAASAREEREKHKFITIPNISDPNVDRGGKSNEPKIVPRVRNAAPFRINKSNIHDFVCPKTTSDTKELYKKRCTVQASGGGKGKEENRCSPSAAAKIDRTNEQSRSPKEEKGEDRTVKPEDETALEIEIEELNDRLSGIAVDEKDLILRLEENSKRPFLIRSQSDRSFSKPEVTATNVNFADTMRLSLNKKSKDTFNKIDTPESAERTNDDITKQREEAPNEEKNVEKAENSVHPSESVVEKMGEMSSEIAKKEEESTTANAAKGEDEKRGSSNEHFRGMKPTSWSPPPGRQKHRLRIGSDGGATATSEESHRSPPPDDHKRTISSGSTTSWNFTSSHRSSKIEIGPATPSENNICKIAVSPRASPLIHRLEIGPGVPKAVKRTSILINGDQGSSNVEASVDNKVTISVGGEDSVCNPTVISVNSESATPKIQSSSENRTLVILDDYKSNIVVESVTSNDGQLKSQKNENSNSKGGEEHSSPKIVANHVVQVLSGAEKEDKDKANLEVRTHKRDDSRSLQTQEKSPFKDSEDTSKWSALSKEAVISKLLEGSLKKARENGEILDQDAGEAILKILKQSMLKSKEYESSESTTLDANYSRSSSLAFDADFISTNLFLEENPYEVIKEPIYEEIPDEPPPLPLSPPPTENFLKERIYFGDVDYYKGDSYLSEDIFKKSNTDDLAESYLSKSPENFFKKMSISTEDENISTKFELLNFLMDSKDRAAVVDDEEDEDEDEEDDTEGDLEALYEQKETSLGDLSSKSSQISNVSDSSEECNIILTSSPDALKSRTVDIERTDSGVGSESSQASSTRGVARRWRSGAVSSGPGSLLSGIPQVISGDTKLCEDCEQRLDPLITDSGVVYAPFVCRKCSKKRAERKEIITEIVETEQKYGRDLQIILEEFYRPMLTAGLLTPEQLSAIFLNVEELLEHNLVLAEKLKDAVEFAQESGDEDLLTVDVGKIFLESERMLHAFETYCTRQGSASLLLQNLEKEKELLRIFLRVSQMENTVLRRMNLNSFLMVPVQRVTKYPLLLARLLKATPSVRVDVQEIKKRLKQAQTNIELHLEHMNAEAKDVTSTKLWRRISIIQNGRRSSGEQNMVNIKLRKMAVEILEWAHEEARFVLEGRLLVAQPTDNNWRRGRTVKLAPVIAMLVTNGKPTTEYLEFNDDSLFPKHVGIKDATLLLVKEKLGRYSLLREPLYLDKCIVCCETNFEDYFEIQELSSKETFIFKAEDGARTKRWCKTLQAHAQSLGAWRKRRGALPNIMICGVARN